MRNIKLTYEYDGSKFFGFQIQNEFRTVQGEIEKSIKKVINEEVNLVSAGRTDRGVHANMQVSNFKTDCIIPLYKLNAALNNILPDDIYILKVEDVDDEFHSRFSAKDRTYKYIMKVRSKYSVFESNYITYIKDDLDLEKFNKILAPLLGEHNFESFRQAKCAANNPIRTIKELYCVKEEDKYIVTLRANAFLKSMVRIIMGASLAMYFGYEENDFIAKCLEIPDKKGKKLVSEARGLYLFNVDY